jgi:hypothetical protein
VAPPLLLFSVSPLDKTDAVEKYTFGKPGSKESRKRRRKKEKALLRIEVEKFAKKQARSPITTAPTANPSVRETEDLEEEAVPTLEEKLRPNDLTLVDRLRACQSHWDKNCSRKAATIVQFGLRLGWAFDGLDLMKPPNHDRGEYERKIPEQNALFCNEMKALVARGCAKMCQQRELNCVSPYFDVTKIDGSKRPLGDFTWVNAFTDPPSFSMVSVWDICTKMTDNCWFGVWDKSKAFEHLGLHRDDQPYAGTSYTENGKPRTFLALTTGGQGLSAVPQAFETVAAESHRFAQMKAGKDIQAFRFADDGIAMMPKQLPKQKAEKKMHGFLKEIQAFGWKLSLEKSYPKVGLSKTATFGGFTYNSKAMTIQLKQTRINKTMEKAELLINKNQWTPREVQALTSSIFSALAVLLKKCKLYTRALNRFLSKWVNPHLQGKDLDLRHPACKSAKQEAIRILALYKTNPTRHLRKKQRTVLHIITLDASNTGVGSVKFSVEGNGIPTIAVGALTKEEQDASSTLREMLALLHTMRSHAEEIKNTATVMITDNKNLLVCVPEGSKHEDIHAIALLIEKECDALHLDLKLLWTRRCNNEASDSCSRIAQKYDICDYSLNEDAYQRVCRLAKERPTFDVFASNVNRKTGANQFASLFLCPDTCAVNGLQNHPHDYCIYAFPPKECVLTFLQNLSRENETTEQIAIMILPREGRMNSTIRSQVVTEMGLPRPGVTRLCKITKEQVTEGPHGRPPWRSQKDFHFEAYLFDTRYVYHI